MESKRYFYIFSSIYFLQNLLGFNVTNLSYFEGFNINASIQGLILFAIISFFMIEIIEEYLKNREKGLLEILTIPIIITVSYLEISKLIDLGYTLKVVIAIILIVFFIRSLYYLYRTLILYLAFKKLKIKDEQNRSLTIFIFHNLLCLTCLYFIAFKIELVNLTITSLALTIAFLTIFLERRYFGSSKYQLIETYKLHHYNNALQNAPELAKKELGIDINSIQKEKLYLLIKKDKIKKIKNNSKGVNLEDALFANNYQLAIKLGLEGNLDNDVNAQGWKPLLVAVAQNYHDLTEKILELGAKTEFMNTIGMSPINKAVINADLEMIKLLLKYNADINYKDGNGNSALHKSIELNNFEIFKFLINKGAKLNTRNNFRFNIQQYCRIHKRNKFLKFLKTIKS